MSEIRSVFRSQATEVLAAWEAYKAACEAKGDLRVAFMERFPGYELLGNGFANSHHITGIRGRGEPGEGWKSDGGQDWSPRGNTKAGKALLVELRSIEDPPLKVPGVPNCVSSPGYFRFPSFIELEGALYVCWSCDPQYVTEENGINLSLWEPVKLSAYYAAKERAEEATGEETTP